MLHLLFNSRDKRRSMISHITEKDHAPAVVQLSRQQAEYRYQKN